MTSRPQMIIETLKSNKGTKFTARELAKLFIERYPDALADKRTNPRYDTDDKFIAQLAAEIGGERTVRDKPRPRLYFWDDEPQKETIEDVEIEIKGNQNNGFTAFSEHDLYPMLIEFLNKDMGLNCQSIDERRSINSQGSGGNHWLHPDIVAMEPLDQSWDETVRTCVRHGNDKSIVVF